MEAHAYRSSTGSSQFTMLPYRFPKTDVCTYYNTNYRQYVLKSFKPPASDAPYTEDPEENVCELYRMEGEVSHFKSLLFFFLTTILLFCFLTI